MHEYCEVPGYTITEDIYLGSSVNIYRAYKNEDSECNPVVIKAVAHPSENYRHAARLEEEYLITRSLRGAPNIIAVKGFINKLGCCAIILEDFGGHALDTLIQKKDALDQCTFLTYSIQLCEALHTVHQNWFVHKDVNPSNTLVNPVTGVLKLIDFGVTKECSPTSMRESSAPNTTFEGTIQYISPEQVWDMYYSHHGWIYLTMEIYSYRPAGLDLQWISVLICIR